MPQGPEKERGYLPRNRGVFSSVPPAKMIVETELVPIRVVSRVDELNVPSTTYTLPNGGAYT